MKTILVLISCLLVFAGCSKNNNSAEPSASPTITTKATIDYLGDPRVDGFGWTLRIGSTYEIPTNLPEAFKVDEQEVNVTYKRTEQVYPCRCSEKKFMVEIITITRI
ncbi:hypothetical protein EXU57_13495 [Segetibacter sp. 3557_3]|uniref:hypothetical protein n=1 Tax=Segetibacter sp. 3557_3 TaxID=2547429 RepID=UPI001058BDAF|nr:hypothetical protein [Segetibacter sp. 3557_3]TDH25121.1 hypothetical protein EXU57_13495 [Segetibacter sp. 3557_3]